MHKLVDCDALLRYPFAKSYKLKRIESRVLIENTSEVYKPIYSKEDENFFRNDWTVLGFRALKYLQKTLPEQCTMCIVGTGGGLDALGAIEILNPESLLITDLSHKALNQADKNIQNNIINKDIEINKQCSFLYNNFKLIGKTFDFIYENLPNLPLSKAKKGIKSDQPITASYYFKNEVFEDIPKQISDNLLVLHWLFLKSAKKYLKKDGIVLCSIGGRIEYSIIEQMFRDAGFEPELIIYDFKRQNEAASNLPGYASEEKKNKGSVKFKFYKYNRILGQIPKDKYSKIRGFAGNVSLLKKILEGNELSAQQAFKEFKRNKTEIGHEVFFVAGRQIIK